MTNSAPPFARLLVPYDGSEPAQAALRVAIAIAKDGAQLTVLTVVDEQTIVAQSAASMAVFDPAPLLDALDEQGKALLADANDLCKKSSLVPALETAHDVPVSAIVKVIDSRAFDLVVMGTHARRGVARAFLGSTTAGVLRMNSAPVLTVRTLDELAAPFSRAVVAIDDSESADAAATVAANLVRTEHTKIVACHVVETEHVYDQAFAYGLQADELTADMHRGGRAIVHSALVRAALPADTPIEIREGAPADAIIAVATKYSASLIVAGTHGRRGLRRLFLGSVAEQLVRTSPMPVMIVPMRRLS